MTASKKLIQAAAGSAGGDFYPYTIDNSARFNDDDSAYLYRTPSSAGSQDATTISVWVKRANQGVLQNIFWQGNASEGNHNNSTYAYWQADNSLQFISETGGSAVGRVETTALYRDSSAWYHLVFVYDSANATTNDRMRIYVNGERVTALDINTMPSQNADSQFNRTDRVLHLGRGTSAYADCYFSEFVLVDGQALDPASFGQSKNGVWVPKNVSGLTFGTNGFYLKFDNASALGTDSSGNGNNFTVSGLTSSDQMIDTPTNNFATLNPLLVTASAANTYANGNLEATTGTTGGGNATATMAIPASGKWYFEFTPTAMGTGINLGLWEPDASIAFGYTVTPSIAYLSSNGAKRVNNSTTTYGASWTTSDVMGVAIDIDGSTVTFYKNNTSQGSISFDASGLLPFFGDNTGASGCTGSINFGQLGFTYTPPTGHLALSTANLPEPAIGPNSATTSDENFNTVLYTGNGTDNRSITGLGFDPDFTWLKSRSNTYSHVLFDSIRGNGAYLISDDTAAENGYGTLGWTNSGTSTDGFIVDYGTNPSINGSGSTFVAWNWKGNGSGSSNTDGSITSTVSANTDAGFSIVTYTGSGSTGQETIGVGLNWSGKNKVVITKNRDDATFNWGVNSNILASNKVLTLNTTNDDSQENSSHYITYETNGFRTYNGGNQILNLLGDSYIAYCFAEVEGFSKFGSYTGNGSADGPFIYTGFRPAWIMFKCATQAFNHWYIHDAKRNTYNLADRRLYPSDAGPEGSGGGYGVDINSNGYKIRNTDSGWNGSGQTYIYMAFAEMPFKYSVGR